MTTQREKAERLRSLHQRGDPLVLVNAWDAVSARILEHLDVPAIATTSAGIAWAEGFSDGERILRGRMLAAVERITSVVSVPVTADLEGGYGPTIEDAVETARGAIAAGAVGMNFEDWDETANAMTSAKEHSTRISAIRKEADGAGIPVVINARTDVYLKRVGSNDDWRFKEATRRANQYLETGADCVYVPGVTDERTIEALVKAIDGPLNVLAAPETPNIARLAQLGVARVSVGSAAMSTVLAEFREIARSVKESGSFAFTSQRIPYAEINSLFT